MLCVAWFTVRLRLSGQPGMGPVFKALAGGERGRGRLRLPVIQTVPLSPPPSSTEMFIRKRPWCTNNTIFMISGMVRYLAKHHCAIEALMWGKQ